MKDIADLAFIIEREFQVRGYSPPKIIIKNWQDWVRILGAANAQVGMKSISANWVSITVAGLQFEYGGEWPHPADNSDVR
jgi:hypothetical protein